MPSSRPSPVQIAVLRYVHATKGVLGDPGNLQIARECVAKGWLTGGADGGFEVTEQGAALAGEA